MKLTLKTLKNEKHVLEVNPSETVGDVKKRIETELKLGEVASQRLIHSGKVLKDDQTIEQCKIKENEFLVVMVSGAAKTAVAAKPKPAEASTPTPAPAPAAQPSASAVPTPAATSSVAPAARPAASSAAPAATAPSPAQSAAAQARLDQAAASNLVTGPQYEEMVANLMALGFPHEQVVVALRASFNNPDRAAQYLFNGIPEDIMRQFSAPQQQRQPQGAAEPATGAGAPQRQSSGASSGAAAMEAEPQGQGLDAAALMNAPEFQQLRQLMQQNPNLIPMLLNNLMQQNPEALEQLGLQDATPESFARLLADPNVLGALNQGAGAAMGGGAGGPGPASHVIQVTPEEKAAIDRLVALGFPRQKVVEAFLLCDRNEELAANYLFENNEFGGADDDAMQD